MLTTYAMVCFDMDWDWFCSISAIVLDAQNWKLFFQFFISIIQVDILKKIKKLVFFLGRLKWKLKK